MSVNANVLIDFGSANLSFPSYFKRKSVSPKDVGDSDKIKFG